MPVKSAIQVTAVFSAVCFVIALLSGKLKPSAAEQHKRESM